jgi:hypothetical protein
MLELQNRVQSAEYMLRTQFANMVGDLVLAELAAPYITGIDQEAPHEPIDDFALWAITGMHIGRRLGLETVELLPGEKNSWLRPNEPERNTRIIRKYTTTAYRCGFDRGEPGEIWVRDL